MLKIYNDPNSNTNLMAHTRLDSNQIVSTAFCNCRWPPTDNNRFIHTTNTMELKIVKKLTEDR